MAFSGISPTPVLSENKSNHPAECDIHKSPCSKSLSGLSIIFDINPKPIRAMTDLNFTVTISSGEISENPYIDLGMPGMNMGPNRVLLKEIGQGMYKGVGVIVRCKSGRRTWKATITIPNIGSVEYVFDAIY